MKVSLAMYESPVLTVATTLYSTTLRTGTSRFELTTELWSCGTKQQDVGHVSENGARRRVLSCKT